MKNKLVKILLLAVLAALPVFSQTSPIGMALGSNACGNPGSSPNCFYFTPTVNGFPYWVSGLQLGSTAAPTNGQILIGSTGAAPALATITGTAGQITSTVGPGTITMSIPGTTDGFYFVGPENCSMALTTGAFAANPANAGGLAAPGMVRAASGNTIMQLTTTAAANTSDVVCDITPPSRLTSGKGITVTAVNYLYGYSTTALTSIGTAALNTITYPAAGGAPAGTVAAAGGVLTVTAGTNHGTPGAVTTSGQCYNEKLVLGTPLALNTDNTRLTWQNTFVQSGVAATVMQICGSIVYYNNAVL